MQTSADKWYLINDVDKIDTPALIIHPERVKNNIDVLKGMINNVSRLRPHVKTHKSADVTRLLLQAGIIKFKCATIAEAEMLAMNNSSDVLLAYQPAGPKADRLIQLIRSYPHTSFSCLADNEHNANYLSGQAIAFGVEVGIYIDLNVGMNRTGILPNEKALQLYLYCKKLPGLKVIGLHAYDGHIHDNDFEVRNVRANKVMGKIEYLKQSIIAHGIAEPILVMGGTPTFPIYAVKEKIECSPGTFVYWDAGYQQSCPEQPFQLAALVITRVVSAPGENLLCLDLGHKAVSAENELNKRVVFLNAPEFKIISQSEEHLVVDAGQGHHYQIGDTIYAAPYHICPTIALYDEAFVVNGHQVTSVWQTIARKRKIKI